MSSRTFRAKLAGLAAAMVLGLLAVAPANALPIVDPANDYLASYTGNTTNGDLDILSTAPVFDGVAFHVGGTMNGAIGTTNPKQRFPMCPTDRAIGARPRSALAGGVNGRIHRCMGCTPIDRDRRTDRGSLRRSVCIPCIGGQYFLGTP